MYIDRVFVKFHIIRCVWDLVTDHNVIVNDLKWCFLIMHVQHNIFYIICYIPTLYVCYFCQKYTSMFIRTLISFIICISCTCITIYIYMAEAHKCPENKMN